MIPGKEWNFVVVPSLESQLNECFILIRRLKPGTERYDYYLKAAKDLQEEYKERTGDYYRLIQDEGTR